jgi:hypothetical protein
MDPIDNERTTAQELVSYAQEQGFDLESLRNDSVFQKKKRWVFLWRKDESPSSGPANEQIEPPSAAPSRPVNCG